MTQLEMFKHNWKPNYCDSSYECLFFNRDLNNLVEEIRADERKKLLDEVVEYINTMPTYSYGVSMLSAEEYIKKSDLIDMLEKFKEQSKCT